VGPQTEIVSKIEATFKAGMGIGSERSVATGAILAAGKPLFKFLAGRLPNEAKKQEHPMARTTDR